MGARRYTEDTLVQQTTAEYLEQQLGWESVYAYNNEDFGPDSLLGRKDRPRGGADPHLRAKAGGAEPGPAGRSLRRRRAADRTSFRGAEPGATNREKYELIRDGVQVTFRNDKGERDASGCGCSTFDDPDNNRFLCVRELWVRGDLYRRRADIVGFVNGLPLLFIECKNVTEPETAYEQNFSDYKDTIPICSTTTPS
jgi:type I restriction enzyme, R subunit